MGKSAGKGGLGLSQIGSVERARNFTFRGKNYKSMQGTHTHTPTKPWKKSLKLRTNFNPLVGPDPRPPQNRTNYFVQKEISVGAACARARMYGSGKKILTFHTFVFTSNGKRNQQII